MRYTFPYIVLLDDVLPHIGEDFYVAKKGEYTVVNYHSVTSTLFPEVDSRGAAIRRECRGLIFDTDTGKLIARRLHKFFNMNEKLETAENMLPDKASLVAYEKLDGSMITPMYLTSGTRLGTKNGITDTSIQAEEFIKDKPNYHEFIEQCRLSQSTPIFEWCSRQNKIVIDHPVDRLVLLDIRGTFNGNYIPKKLMESLASVHQIETVKEMKVTPTEVLDLEGTEGIVLQYPDGHRVKVKSTWYLQLHRAKESASSLRDVVMLILDAKLDDLKPLLLPHDLTKINMFEDLFWKKITTARLELEALHKTALSMTRKEFALLPTPNRRLKGCVFKLLDSKTEPEYLQILVSSIKNTAQAKEHFKNVLEGLLEWQIEF